MKKDFDKWNNRKKELEGQKPNFYYEFEETFTLKNLSTDLLTYIQCVCYTLHVNLTAFSAKAGTVVSF